MRQSGIRVDVSASAARAMFRRQATEKETTMFSLNHIPSFRSRSARSISRRLTSVVLGLWAVIFVSSPAFAQTVTVTISGTVTDPNSPVAARSNVEPINDPTHDKRDQHTNESGRFSSADV